MFRCAARISRIVVLPRVSGSIEPTDGGGGEGGVPRKFVSTKLPRITGDVTVAQDSSGDIRGRDVGGSVVIARDSSGDIRFRDVSNDFLVERDSSGDVVAQGIGGDFAVLADGSGEIRHSDVMGSVDIPEKR